MQSMQRQFGKLMNRGPGDNAKVSVLLNDYEDADRLLARITESAKAWRDSWVSILSAQLEVVTVYESLYDPIVGAYDGHGAPLTPTSELQLTRTFKLKEAYSDLKAELIEDIGTIDDRIIRPATDARDAIAPIRKTIKKRENKRLDYEKVQDRVAKMHRKPNKTAKEDAALAKAEDELANLTESSGASPSSARIGSNDYFSSRDRPSTASTVASSVSQGATPAYPNGIGKKKPPPPPPPKRIPSTRPDEYVVALYDFVGQGAGDLSFSEGDMIKIVKKTNTDQDWWVGELAGVRGNFPANYCKAT
ncbi:putative sh3 domain signaling protein [Phaeoacremonium minimum UCRPA7]|uniref:Putative sh3 domain signaling protein n=1 Tax=Phaeoacremonium minimum (strain UCR-PA7) TaxID=1286976 RepID=R8BCL1_PHAM7|nr:putative sh3 domain signaling protein [Phaeoacremonium minimum UCRPA7]EON97038.1 putative sh3 domain signaling protein [Phaeoacremonium minimum UCRPA7]